MTATIHLGDCRAVLASLPAESIHCVFTSPPYFGARVYDGSGDEWGGGAPDCDHSAAVAAASAKRSGERVALSGSRATQEGTKQAQYTTCPACGAARIGRPLGMESAMDCLAWARGDPPCGECYTCRTREWAGEVWRVLRLDGVFWLNVGDSYSTHAPGRTAPEQFNKPRDLADGRDAAVRAAMQNRRIVGAPPEKSLLNVPGRLHDALQADGWICRQRVKWHKDNGMPEASPDRPTTKHEDVLMLTKSPQYWFDNDAIRKPYLPGSFLRAVRGDSPDAKFVADGGYSTEKTRGKAARIPRGGADGGGADENGAPLLMRNGKPRKKSEFGFVARNHVGAPSEKSKQIRRDKKDGGYGSGSGLAMARALDANRRGDVETAREALDTGGICAHPLGAVRGSIWTGPTAQFRGRDSEHYAVGPTWLAARCVLAAAPERTCPSCGAGWIRMAWVLAAARRRASSRLKVSTADRPTVEADEVNKLQHGKSQSFRTFRQDSIGRGGPVKFFALIPKRFAHLSDYAAALANVLPWHEVYREDIPPFGEAKNAHLLFAPGCACGGTFHPDNPPAAKPGMVLDPFTGVGTTALAAGLHGRDFVGAELSPNYKREAEARLAREVGEFQPSLAI